MNTRIASLALLLFVAVGSVKETMGAGLTPPTFSSGTQINAGGATIYRALVGDVNGDKLPDVITIVQNAQSPTGSYLTVRLGSGSGAVGSLIQTPVNFGANQFVLVGDVNGDGKADVLLVYADNVDVFLSNGDGSFASPQTYGTGINSPVAATLFDRQHRNILDLIVVGGTSQGNGSSVLAGQGDGSFPSEQVAIFPAAVTGGVFADVDNDGNLDFVTNSGFYPGSSNGSFGNAVTFQVSDGENAGAVTPDAVAVADVNGDGKLDVVTANGNWNTVSVFLNHGNRQLVQSGLSQWTGNNPVALTIADLNWDGKADLLVTNAAQSDLDVLLGKGDGTFLSPTPGFGVGGSPTTRAVLADFYGDGNLDALVADNSASVVLARGFGDGTFGTAFDSNIVVAAGASNTNGAISIASGDFNNDGIPDFVAGQSSSSPGTGVIVFLGLSNGTLGKGTVYAASDALGYVAVGDINGDGNADIVASNWATGKVEVLIGNGDGTFQAPVSVTLPGLSNGLVVADLNGDGWQDVAVAGKNSAVYVLLNNGSGSLAFAGTYALSGNGFELATADFNSDGKPDLAVAMTSTSRVAILMGNGDGTFASAPDYDTTLPSPYGIAAGDVNFDGNADLFVSSSSSSQITVALGNGDGTFTSPGVYPASISSSLVDAAPGEVTLADINQDGTMDVVYANAGHSSIGILLGNGSGGFHSPIEFPVGGGALALTTADINSDGWPEVVTADSHFSGVSTLINTTGAATADFTLHASSANLSVSTGGSVSTNLSLTSVNGMTGSVQFACSNLPAALTCSFSPSVLHVQKSNAVTSQLTITASQVVGALHSSGQSLTFAFAIIPVLGGMFFWRAPRMSRSLFLLPLLACILAFSGCQSLTPGPGERTKKTYTITVTATAWNGTAHSTQLQVTVQ